MTMTYEHLIREASGVLGVTLRRHTSRKACGPCPDCGGSDRLVVWLYEGSAWCSRCSLTRWFVDDPEEARKRSLEERVEREQRVMRLRASMSVSVEWMPYNEYAISHPELWLAEGVTKEDIKSWGLGYADSCPSFPASRSLTIPVFRKQTLQDIRHRLLDADEEKDGKYRSHLPDLVPIPFNLDALQQHDQVIVVEGEKKAIIMARHGWLGTIGLPGLNSAELLLQELNRPDSKKPRVTIAFDPGANCKAEKLAMAIPPDVAVYVADCFYKPDDILRRYGPGLMVEMLKQARPMSEETRNERRRL